MANVNFGVNDPLAVKLWSKNLSVEALKATIVQRFIGKTADSLVMVKDETMKGVGDTITYGLRMQAVGAGVLGDGTLEGNEESLTTYSDKLIIDQLRHAHRITGKMSQQRVPFNLRDECLSSLRDWWADRLDTAFFQQICGYTPQADVRFTGNQATIACDAAHYINVANVPGANGLTSPTNTDADVNSATYTSQGGPTLSSAFQLTMIDRAKERAKTLTPAIRPIKDKGKEWYVVFLHPNQITDLRTNPNPGTWLDFQKAAMTGGEISDNPIFTGALGVYNGCVLHDDYRVTQGFAGATLYPNVRRAVFCGAQSVMLGFGRDGGPNKFDWNEKTFDYGNQLGVEAGTIFGMKKTQFNSLDFGTIVMSSYAASH